MTRKRRTRFYHASPVQLRRRDVLVGGRPGGAGYAHVNVCMTDSPAPHATVAERAWEEDWYVYEVRPVDRVKYVKDYGEFQVRAAVVLGHVGRARTLSARATPNATRAPWLEDADGGRRYVSYVCIPPRHSTSTRRRRG